MSAPTPAKPETSPLTYEELKKAVAEGAAAFRCRRRLQPAGGEGDKVFPPTFAGAVYAIEQRRVAGRNQPVTCVLLDSVQSQANRMEQALQDAVDAGEISLPIIEVDFSEFGPTGDAQKDEEECRLIAPVSAITSLQVPHRLADAILRDSEHDGTMFRDSSVGKQINEANLLNAVPIYQLCPTALVFGMWDSTGPKGGLGAKFERAMVSEVVGVGASFGLRVGSRIDPLITKTTGIVLYVKRGGGWTPFVEDAVTDKGGPVKLGTKKGRKGDGKVSEANLGNVLPAFGEYGKDAKGPDPLKPDGGQARQGEIAPGGVTVEYAEQNTILSLACLRRLRFPINGDVSPASTLGARVALAALGLCAATLAFEAGAGLRSRCLLWPDEPMIWHLLAKPGETPRPFSLDAKNATALLKNAVSAAEAAGLKWQAQRIRLKPSRELRRVVRDSQKLAEVGAPDEES